MDVELLTVEFQWLASMTLTSYDQTTHNVANYYPLHQNWKTSNTMREERGEEKEKSEENTPRND